MTTSLLFLEIPAAARVTFGVLLGPVCHFPISFAAQITPAKNSASEENPSAITTAYRLSV
jgi:L-alanine-DL-glutamate epimerase-like enolase superfamily enzyme